MTALAPTLRRHPRFSSAFLARERDVVVYLPPGYDTETNPCPVLYLHDGQNLFEPDRAHVPGQHWRVGETVDALIAGGTIPPLIVVGVDNTGAFPHSRVHPHPRCPARRRPCRRLRTISGGGTEAVHRSHLPDPYGARRHVARGSSLGGLVTLHIGLSRPDVFGALVVMSPSVWWDRRVILTTVRAARPKPDLRVLGRHGHRGRPACAR